jgi:hypothetical protein
MPQAKDQGSTLKTFCRRLRQSWHQEGQEKKSGHNIGLIMNSELIAFIPSLLVLILAIIYRICLPKKINWYYGTTTENAARPEAEPYLW